MELLLVEDNPHDAELTLRSLRKYRLANNIIHIGDGAEALDFLFGRGAYEGRNPNNRPKVILLDLKMPKISGIEVLQELRNNELTKLIPVVVLSSSTENPDVQRCFELGANSYIVKPVEFENFSKAVADIGFYWLLLNQQP
ncbi:response regulator [Nostoc sp. NIES-2111]